MGPLGLTVALDSKSLTSQGKQSPLHCFRPVEWISTCEVQEVHTPLNLKQGLGEVTEVSVSQLFFNVTNTEEISLEEELFVPVMVSEVWVQGSLAPLLGPEVRENLMMERVALGSKQLTPRRLKSRDEISPPRSHALQPGPASCRFHDLPGSTQPTGD